MTATVKRGAGRATHKAKVERHAQRTQLPPRQVQRTIEDAQEVVAEAAAIVARAAAKQRGSTKVLQQQDKPGASKSWVKAAKFAQDVTAKGWTAKVQYAPDGKEEDIVEVLASRGNEHLWISWTRGAMTVEPMPTYTIHDRTIKLRNASAGRKYASRTPEEAQAEYDRVHANKFFRRREIKPKKSRLPFDVKAASDDDVLHALVGRQVSWHNRLTQGTETAVIKDVTKVQIVALEDGDRIVKFCCPKTGYRAFRLSALVRVGRTAKVAE